MHNFIHFIGTGCGRPISGRQLPCYLVALPDGHLVLLECGSIINTDDTSASPINISRINVVVITALNIELIAGLPSLLHSMRLLNRVTPLTILAPKPIESFIQELLAFDQLDVPFDVKFLPIESQEQISLANHTKIIVRETSDIPDKFQVYLQSKWNGNKFTIYYTGKSRGGINEGLLVGHKFVIHDCTYSYDDAYLSAKTGLASYQDAIDFAQQTNPLAMFLVHFSSRYQYPQKDVSRHRVQPHNVIFTFDGFRYDFGHILDSSRT